MERRLRYPGLVPPAARDAIEAFLDDALLTLSPDSVEATCGELVTAIARTLYEVAVRPLAWSVEDYRTTAEDLVDQVIDKSYTQLFGFLAVLWSGVAIYRGPNERPTLEAFRTCLRTVLHASPAWARYQALAQQLATMEPSAAAAPSPELVSVQDAAKQLGVSQDTIRRNARDEYELVRVSARHLKVTQRSIDRVKASARWQFNKR